MAEAPGARADGGDHHQWGGGGRQLKVTGGLACDIFLCAIPRDTSQVHEFNVQQFLQLLRSHDFIVFNRTLWSSSKISRDFQQSGLGA
jgi:hypothetical protein